jgi:hypothetical protein
MKAGMTLRGWIAPLKKLKGQGSLKIKSWSANEGWDDIERLDSHVKEIERPWEPRI